MTEAPVRILFVASEMAPLVKTGGLADVLESLPAALVAKGHDVRVLLPAYAAIETPERTTISAYRAPRALPHTRLFEVRAPRTNVCVWLLDAPGFGDRAGNPYLDDGGQPYPDNAVRFNRLCRGAALMAANACGLDWQPDLVHCHDWQTGLTPVWMMLERAPAASVFTIHNLAYQGLFPAPTLGQLQLPDWLWHHHALEFYNQLAFLKGGLVFADRLSTVSPRYAQEILTPEFGCGVDGVLRQRSVSLSGIVNGIDDAVWDPAHDPWLPAHYRHDDRRGKLRVKQQLLKEFGLLPRSGVPVLAFVGRLVAQKGVDVLLEALPQLFRLQLRLIVLGTGDRVLERQLGMAAAASGGKLAVRLEYNEGLAHRVYGGADMLLMPSRFEPCGLSQLYAQRYGTVPIVHSTGGLADTVMDVSDGGASPGSGGGTGFCFAPLDVQHLVAAVGRAIRVFHDPDGAWNEIVTAGMRCDHSWAASASKYTELYRNAMASRQH